MSKRIKRAAPQGPQTVANDNDVAHTMKQAVEPELAAVLAQQSEEKRKAGRYTLEEAAQLLEAEAGACADTMLKMLMDAAENGDLPVYRPGHNDRYRYGPGFASCVREFYEEARWNQLNDWLEKHERYIALRFPSPNAQAATGASGPSTNKPGEPSAVIIEKFHLGNEWVNRLRHRKAYSYLEAPVLAQPGARGNGKGKNLWNPAQFAKILLDTKVRRGKSFTDKSGYKFDLKRLNTIVEHHFTAWLDEWQEISGWNYV